MRNQRITKILNEMICWSFCLLVFLLPLVFSREVFLSFELVKVSFFRFFVVWILVLIFLKFYLRGGGCSWPKISKWFYVFFGGYLLAVILATVFSLSPFISFWGGYERQQGVLQLMFYWAFFVGSFLYFSECRERVQTVIKAALFGAVAVSALAILQWAFPLLLSDWQVEDLLGRQASTLGHPSFLATYLVLMIPFLFVMWPRTSAGCLVNGVGQKLFRVRLSIFCLMAVVILTALVLAGSRAAVLALLVEVVLMVIFVLRGKRGGGGRWWVLAVLFLVLLVFVGRNSLNEDPWRSVNSRLLVWQESVRLVLDKPFFGHGPEMFREAFIPYMNLELLELEKFNAVPDRAHNQILDLAVDIGIFGMIFYLALWAFLVVKALRSKDLPVRVMGVGLVGLFAANLFGFSVTVHMVFFWLFAGMIMSGTGMGGRERGLNGILTGRKYLQKFLSVFVLAVLLMTFVVLRMVVRDFLADVNYKKGVMAVAGDNNFQAIDYFKRAVELNPRQSEYYLKAAEYSLMEAGYAEGLAKDELLKRAKWFMKRVENRIGTDLNEVLYLKAVLKWREGDFIFSDEIFERLVGRAYFVPKYMLAWARMLRDSGDSVKALEKYRLYLLMVPEVDRLFLKHNPEFNDVLEEMEDLK